MSSEFKSIPDKVGIWWKKGDSRPYKWELDSDTGEICKRVPNFGKLLPQPGLHVYIPEPDWPSLPNRPRMVYASHTGYPVWWVELVDGTWSAGCLDSCRPSDLTPHPHPEQPYEESKRILDGKYPFDTLLT